MTTTTTSADTAADEPDTPPLGELLVRSAVGLRERIAVQALVEEEELLARDNVRSALVTKHDGVMTCRWEGVAGRLYTLGLNDGERAFLGLVLSIVGMRQSSLSAVQYLDERRFKIVLQAMIRLAGTDWIAIGMRL
ncbi:hypothetical protein [Streptomyces sp. ME18-1-4]|uniref:hypothetical protein n=1 Tax=Streptomyces sp. ME18-1-4 TaxID=3028685 RepID=UPI0029BCEE7A|nr:hypothetical protein [Streptomyces sp. ME18-1-4]MDX3244823.1 hypothetical protein [Streptomyces sp. ME18-1-4]